MPKKKTNSKPAPKKESKKKTTKKETSMKKVLPKDIKVNVPEGLKPGLKIVGTVLLVIVAVALVDLLVQYINNDYSVAVINGSRITKSQWHDRLESAYGAGVASQMIEDEIIKLEAKKADVRVEDEEIDAEIDRIIESIGGEEMFNSALEANNITLEELKDQIKIDLLSTKILAPNLEYEEEDVVDFFNQYSDVIFPEETAALEEGEKLDFEKFRGETEEIFVQQEVQMTRDTWMSEKMAEYSIQDNSTTKPKYGFLTITTNIINNLLEGLGDNSVEE
jgi:foldase protein PrsA